MAFRTNKVPAIEKRTVSGSSVSFHSNFALPLKACKVSFSATQAGSGDPSPSNPRAISGVSSIGLMANSTPVSVSLGEERFGGELNVLTGELTLPYIKKKISDINWVLTSNVFRADNNFTNGREGAMCECYANSTQGPSAIPDKCINFASQYWDNNKRIIIKDTSFSTKDEFIENMGDYNLIYPLITPIEVQLTPNQLSTILGNNTFSTDTGTLEITFSDLQEKTASGSVASFNTILQKPLVNGEFTIEAYQEGTGDPSPDNVRNIVGYSEQNITHAHKNLFNAYNFELLNNVPIDIISANSVTVNSSAYQEQNNKYSFTQLYGFEKKLSFHQRTNRLTNPNARCSVRFIDKQGRPITSANVGILLVSAGYETDIVADIPPDAVALSFADWAYSGNFTLSNIQIEIGSTATAYEPYNAEVKTKQLGETVYGGSYNSVTGEKVVNKNALVFSGTEEWRFNTANSFFYFTVSGLNIVGTNAMICSNGIRAYLYANGICRIYVSENSQYIDSTTDMNTIMVNGIKGLYNTTPIESNIGATPIQTFNGANNIFCDTGDTSLVYNDLDLAKRGSFREVFKLP